MQKNEAKLQTIFGRYLQARQWTGGNAVFELKRTKFRSIPLKSIKAHQYKGLTQVKTGSYYKLPDSSYEQKPYDCQWLFGVQGYVVIAYGPTLTGFYIIPVEPVASLKESGAVSLTEVLAAKLGQYVELPRASGSGR